MHAQTRLPLAVFGWPHATLRTEAACFVRTPGLASGCFDAVHLSEPHRLVLCAPHVAQSLGDLAARSRVRGRLEAAGGGGWLVYGPLGRPRESGGGARI
jgi:hypothetical protein